MDISNNKVKVVRVEREFNSFYVVQYCANGVDCSNQSLDLDAVEKREGLTFPDGEYDFIEYDKLISRLRSG